MCRFSAMASGLFACLAGCGDGSGVHHLTDAPLAPDSPPTDALTTVTVTTLARAYETQPATTPHAGVLVFAVGPTGALTGTATTGADGKATVSLPAGGSVTVVYLAETNSPGNTVITYAGVKPGDSLTFGARTTQGTPGTGQAGTMDVTWAAVPNATRYRLSSPCASDSNLTGTTTTIDLSPACQVATAPVGLAAYDANNTVLASVFFPATAYTPNTVLDVTAGQWVAQVAANYAIDLTNVDPAASSADFAGYDEFAFGEYGSFWLSFPPMTFFNVVPAAGTASQSVSVASTAPRPSAAAKLYHQTHVGRKWFFRAGASPVSIDTSVTPWIDTVAVDSSARTLAWTQTSGAYDAATLRFSWSNFDWTVILPPGVTQLDASTTPAELAPYLPTALDGLNMYGCELVDLSSVASYDALRALPEWRATSPEATVRLGDEPAAALADCGEGYHFF